MRSLNRKQTLDGRQVTDLVNIQSWHNTTRLSIHELSRGVVAWWFATNRSQVRVPATPLHVTTLDKLFTHICASVTKQYKLVLANGRWCSVAGKVTVGLASHWPCVTDSVVYPPTGSMAWEREVSTAPKLHLEYYDIFTFIFTPVDATDRRTDTVHHFIMPLLTEVRSILSSCVDYYACTHWTGSSKAHIPS